MPEYRRPWVSGGTYFITLVTFRRQRLFSKEAVVHLWRTALRQAATEKPFDVMAGVVLPDHLHLIVSLPLGVDDLSSRIGRAKSLFTKSLRAQGRAKEAGTRSRDEHREADVWQRRFHDHLIRDENDFEAYLDYLHYNPVKHGLVDRPRDWKWSSFTRWVQAGVYSAQWCCGNDTLDVPNFSAIEANVGE